MQTILTNLQRLQNQLQNIAKSRINFGRKQFSIRGNQLQILGDNNMNEQTKEMNVSSDVEKIKAKQILQKKGYTEVSKKPAKKPYLRYVKDPKLKKPLLP